MILSIVKFGIIIDIADYPAFQKLIIQEVGNAILDIPNNPAIGSEAIRDCWPAMPYIVLFVAIFYNNDVSKRGVDDIALIDWRVTLVMQTSKLPDSLFIDCAMQAVIVNPNEAVVMQQIAVSPHSIVCAFASELDNTHSYFFLFFMQPLIEPSSIVLYFLHCAATVATAIVVLRRISLSKSCASFCVAS